MSKGPDSGDGGDRRYAFLGCGAMASAIVRGILKAGVAAPDRIFVWGRGKERREALAAELGVHVLPAVESLRACDVIFLGIRPADFPTAVQEYTPFFHGGQLFVSMMSSLTIHTLRTALCAAPGAGRSSPALSDGTEVPRVVRIMPNTSVAMLEGVTTVSVAPGEPEDSADAKFVLATFSRLGKALMLPEEQINPFSGIAGCAPAYFFQFASSMVKKARELGIDERQATEVVAMVMKGASAMLLAGEKPAGQLRDDVCSKGGCTIEAVKVFQGRGIDSLVADAIDAAIARGDELISEFNQK